MRTRRILSLVLSIVLMFGAMFALAEPVHAQAATEKISKSKLTIEINGTGKLTISSKSKPVWLSTDSSIASVSEDGTVTAEKIGQCDIYGIIGSKAFKCSVTVKDRERTTLRRSTTPTPTPLPSASAVNHADTKVKSAKTVSVASNKLSEAVDFSSKYAAPYSEQQETYGRTPVYFYHPRKLVLKDQKAKVLFWVSSDPSVIRAYSDGAVEAYAEGIADVTAYDSTGAPIETFYLYATTSADADPVGSTMDYSKWESVYNAYDNIEFQDIQEALNNITDYVTYLYVKDSFYSEWDEGSSPRIIDQNGMRWIQMGNSDWIFKNRGGICCNVCAGALYCLAGDYEKYGTIQMAGENGHTIFWCFENGTYYVYDFTRIISDVSELRYGCANNVYIYVDRTLGRGKTLKAAFEDCCSRSDTGYLNNKIIYAVELTGLDYYPAESNTWMSTGDFSGKNIAYFVTGTNVETLYTAKGVKFETKFVDRDLVPVNMRTVTEPTNTDAIHTDTNLGRLRPLTGSGTTSASKIALTVDKNAKSYTQSSLLTVAASKTTNSSTYATAALRKGRTMIYLGETQKLDAGSEKPMFWYSTDANIIRVQSDGTVKAYAEGTAEVYAVSSKGKVLKTFKLIATTHADADPLAATVGNVNGTVDGIIPEYSMYGLNELPEAKNDFRKINLEDIPSTLHTITDYVGWMFANYVYPNGDEEPVGPYSGHTGMEDHEGFRWYPMANDDCVFTNFVGVCCNYAAGALMSLAGDYEANGLIMMAGSMGHVINWFYENGTYYVIDYMCVAEERETIRTQYDSNIIQYVKDKIGTGATVGDALDDYYARNSSRKWYYENTVLYATDATGYNFYQTECNNWSNSGILNREKGINTLFCSEANTIELLYLKENFRFDYEYIASDMIPTCIKTLYSLDIPAGSIPTDVIPRTDNTVLDVNKIVSGQSSGTSSQNTGSDMNISSTGEYIYAWNGDTYVFAGIADGYARPKEYTILSNIDGHPVTVIGSYAMAGWSEMKELHVPSSVTSVGDYAFSGIESSVTVFCSPGSATEQYCKANNIKYKNE